MEDLKVSVFQICSTDSVEQNQNKILELLQKVHSDVDLCLFPENSLYINIDKNAVTPVISLQDGFFKKLQDLCFQKKMTVHLGSVPLYENEELGGKLFNSSVVVHSDKRVEVPYNKIHMFKAEVGDLKIDESINYSAGKTPSVIDVKGWKVGLSICFDLRFSELYSYYAKKECDLILVPSAFFRKTGLAHWEVLLRARAIESQCYVLAPGQVGVHESVDGSSIRKSYGHSLGINPWGELLFDLEDDEKAIEVELKKVEIDKVRKAILMEHKI